MSISTLDTRDLETRRREIEDELDDLISAIPDDVEDADYLDAAETLANWLGIADHDHLEFIGNQFWDQGQDYLLHRWASRDSDGEILKELNELSGDVQGWDSGVTLIADADFEEYAQEFARETGGRNSDIDSWPYDHIDWAAAATALAQDYSTCEYEGITYQYSA